MEIKEVEKDLQVVWHPHPINPLDGRNIAHYTIHEQSTVRDLLIAHGINQNQPIVIFVDDKLLTVEEWDTVRPKNGQIINVQASVADGGDGSNVLQMVAMIALVVVVSYFTMGAGSVALVGAIGETAAMAVGAAAMVAGSLLINTVFAAQAPSLNMDSMGGSYGAASPTYSLSGSQNRARPYESMPVVYGQMKWTPDAGMNPYVQYKGDDQYLYQIFNLGLSTCTHTSWKIGDTLVSNYEDVVWSYPDSNGKISAFPGNVDSDVGANLTYAESWIYKTTSINTYQIGIDLEAVLFYANDSGGLSDAEVEIEINYRKTGTSTWLEPSEILVSGSKNFVTGDYVSVSVTKETGDYEAVWSDETYDWTWVPVTVTVTEQQFKAQKSGGTIKVKGASQTPLRATILIRNLTADQYDFRIRRITADSTDPRTSTRTSFSSYKSYQTNYANYKGQTRYGLTIRASDQLNGVITQMNVVSSAKVNYWNGSSWVFAYTQNPAYIFMDFCLGRKDVDGKITYGLGLPPSKIDYVGLRQWASFCADEGLTFNAVIDGSQTASDILVAISRCGFASPTWASGKIGVIWDKRNQSPVAAFGMSNIIKGSFEVSYITEQLSDEIIVNYVDATTWETTEVRKKIPGVTNPLRPSAVNLFGCTNKAMAGKFANYLAAQQYYRKRRISWQTDFEGFICNRGDVVLLSHDLTQWGYSGRIVSVDGTTVTLDRDVPRNGSTEYLMIKQPNGTMTTYEVVADTGNKSVIQLTEAPTLQSGEVFDHIWMFSPLETPGKKVKIISVQPASESRLQIVATDEDQEFYAAWDGTFEEPTQYSLLQQAKKPVIANLKFAEELAIIATGRIITRATIYWQQKSSQIEKCDVRYRINNGSWYFKTFYCDTKLVVDFDGNGSIEAIVTPVNGYFSGTAITGSYTLYGKQLKPITPTGLTTTVLSDKVVLDWANNPDLDLAGYEVRATNSGWGESSGRLFKGSASQATLEPPAAGETVTWYVKAYDTSGNYSEVAASKSFTSASVNNTTSITHSFYDDSLTSATVTLDWADVTAQFGTSYYEVSYDSIVKTIKASTITLPANWIGTRTFVVKTVDNNGNKSSGSSKSITKLIPASPTGLRTQVIDNTLMLYWSEPPVTTLPISHYRIKKGASWDTATLVGNKDGEFTTINELQSGTYKYWIATVDTDGYESVPVSIAASVQEPPDFVFNGEFQSNFTAGTLSSAVMSGGYPVMPVNTTETWSNHFSSRAWTSPQDQVSAGYPIYIQPTNLSGYYQEIFDFGTMLGSSKITVSYSGNNMAGSPATSCKIETSPDNATWQSFDGVTEIYGLNFQYVRVTITASGDDKALYQLTSLGIRCDSKQKTDSGSTSCISTDTYGTIANFNKDLIDVTSITVTGAGTAPVIAVYDYQDSIISGTYSVSSNVLTVNATAHGLISGQNVRCNFSSGTASPVTVTIATAATNSFTASLTTADTSGNLSIYPESMRIYLFNSSGTRVSGTASWTVRGY